MSESEQKVESKTQPKIVEISVTENVENLRYWEINDKVSEVVDKTLMELAVKDKILFKVIKYRNSYAVRLYFDDPRFNVIRVVSRLVPLKVSEDGKYLLNMDDLTKKAKDLAKMFDEAMNEYMKRREEAERFFQKMLRFRSVVESTASKIGIPNVEATVVSYGNELILRIDVRGLPEDENVFVETAMKILEALRK